MKNTFKLSSLLFIGVILFQVSCSEDPAPVVVDPLVGKWAISKAIFNSTSVDPTDVLIINEFPTAQGPITLQLPSGSDVLAIIIGAMADNVCNDPANYATFFLELTADGKLLLSCPGESNNGVDTGTWNQNGTTITLTVVTSVGNLPIAFNNFAMLTDGSKFNGQSANFPMTQTFGVDLDPATNLQFLNIDMEFTRLP